MNIKEEARILAGIVKKLCEERNIDIQNIINKGNKEFNEIWIEAIEMFKQRMGYEKECRECKKTKSNIREMELVAESRRAELEGEVDLIKDGVVIGLDMALAMIK